MNFTKLDERLEKIEREEEREIQKKINNFNYEVYIIPSDTFAKRVLILENGIKKFFVAYSDFQDFFSVDILGMLKSYGYLSLSQIEMKGFLQQFKIILDNGKEL